METLCLLFVIAIFSNSVLGLSFKNKRQWHEEDSHEEDSDEEDMENSYGWNRPNRPDGGRFPGQVPDQFPGQLQGQQTNPTAPTTLPTTVPKPVPTTIPTAVPTKVLISNVNRATTQSSSVQVCIRLCPVTSEYNPVCGSDGVTYDNPGRLICAQSCGVTVNLLRSSRCPTTTVAPAS